MVSRFGSPDPNWQFAGELARRRFTTRPPPISNSVPTRSEGKYAYVSTGQCFPYQLIQKRQKNTPSSLISSLQVQVKSAMRGKVKGG